MLNDLSEEIEKSSLEAKIAHLNSNIKLIASSDEANKRLSVLSEKLYKALSEHQRMIVEYRKKSRELDRQQKRVVNASSGSSVAPNAAPASNVNISEPSAEQVASVPDTYANRNILGQHSSWRKSEESEETEKSDYGKAKDGSSQYVVADNVKRKLGNTGDRLDLGPNSNVKAYSSKPGQPSAKQAVGLESKKYQKINRKQPVKIYSPDEIKQLEEKRKLAASADIDIVHSEKLIKFNSENQLADSLKKLMLKGGILQPFLANTDPELSEFNDYSDVE